MGCAWWFLSDIERDLEGANGWAASDTLMQRDTHLSLKYGQSFYWGCAMATAVVPMDVVPVTLAEVGLSTCSLILGVLLNAYIISALATTLSNIDSKREHARTHMDSVQDYLTYKRVPNALKRRIMSFYAYLYSSAVSAEKSQLLRADSWLLNLATAWTCRASPRTGA